MDIDLNSKKVYFFITIAVIFLITQLIFTAFYYLVFIELNIFEQKISIYILFLLLQLSVFLLLSKKILEPIFRSEENIKKSIKNTLHELNIPVSTIKLNIELLKSNIEDEKNIKRLQRVEIANENLIKLYNNMEYELKKELERVDLEEFYFKDALNKSLIKFEEQINGIKIDVDVQNPLLYCDYFGFIIVLDNLISNAIKYNSKIDGYIKIEQKGDIFSIYNNGESILPKNIMLVFDRYFQENSSNKGYGIGLAVIKEFCDKYNIAINIDTKESGNKIILNLKNIINREI